MIFRFLDPCSTEVRKLCGKLPGLSSMRCTTCETKVERNSGYGYMKSANGFSSRCCVGRDNYLTS